MSRSSRSTAANFSNIKYQPVVQADEDDIDVDYEADHNGLQTEVGHDSVPSYRKFKEQKEISISVPKPTQATLDDDDFDSFMDDRDHTAI